MRMVALGVLLAPLLITGCKTNRVNQNKDKQIDTDNVGDDDDDDDTDGLAYGDDCSAEPTDCGIGMSCAGDGTCRFDGEPGTFGEGEACAANDYCGFGLACAANGTCAPAGNPGTVGVGGQCDDSSDCAFFLQCSEANTCYGFQPPFWLGAECDPLDSDPDAFRVYFEVPEINSPNDEFYRFPMPNDGRVFQGNLNLQGHPTPGVLIPELGDVAADVIGLIEDEMDGWGNNQAVLMRFSHILDVSTMSLGEPGVGSISVVDITPTSDTYGERHPGGYHYTSSRGQYICHNWIGLHPTSGRPYLPGHTYAAIITTDIRKKDSAEQLSPDADMSAMLSSSPPADARLTDTWEAYEGFREYLDDFDVPASAIAVASVFTVQDPTEPPRLLQEAVAAADPPTTSGLHLCDSDPGPYALASDPLRGCHGTSNDFHEIQGLLKSPQYQQGFPPYKEADDGGSIDFSQGAPSPDRYDDLHFALTIPKGATMPVGGWPVVLYFHGTNGIYRNVVHTGVSKVLSDVELDSGDHVHFATIGIEAPVHGERRFEDNWDNSWLTLDPGAYDPDVLYFNPLNPRAARDNAMQAAADAFYLVRAMQELSWDASGSPTGEAISFDTANIYYMGHSQGATTGAVAMGYEPDVKAAVFSGAGGLLIESFLNKKLPYDMPSTLKVGLADPDLGRHHPLLNLAQAWAERSDGVNHGRFFHYDPSPAGGGTKHTLQTYGIGDGYTPDDSQYALVRASRAEQVTNGYSPLSNVNEETAPISGNRSGGVTAIVTLYEGTAPNDSHFVIFDEADAERQYSQFLGTAVFSGTPEVVLP